MLSSSFELDPSLLAHLQQQLQNQTTLQLPKTQKSQISPQVNQTIKSEPQHVNMKFEPRTSSRITRKRKASSSTSSIASSNNSSPATSNFSLSPNAVNNLSAHTSPKQHSELDSSVDDSEQEEDDENENDDNDEEHDEQDGEMEIAEDGTKKRVAGTSCHQW
jgi:hypothetical protein